MTLEMIFAPFSKKETIFKSFLKKKFNPTIGGRIAKLGSHAIQASASNVSNFLPVKVAINLKNQF